MASWQGDKVLGRNPQAVWREVDDEIFICSPDGEVMHTLRDVAADIWRACDGQNTVRDITELLLTAYDVDPGTAEADLQECLQILESKHLISTLDS